MDGRKARKTEEMRDGEEVFPAKSQKMGKEWSVPLYFWESNLTKNLIIGKNFEKMPSKNGLPVITMDHSLFIDPFNIPMNPRFFSIQFNQTNKVVKGRFRGGTNRREAKKKEKWKKRLKKGDSKGPEREGNGYHNHKRKKKLESGTERYFTLKNASKKGGKRPNGEFVPDGEGVSVVSSVFVLLRVRKIIKPRSPIFRKNCPQKNR